MGGFVEEGDVIVNILHNQRFRVVRVVDKEERVQGNWSIQGSTYITVPASCYVIEGEHDNKYTWIRRETLDAGVTSGALKIEKAERESSVVDLSNVDTDRFPDICPGCGSPAYTSPLFNSNGECSNPGCKQFDRW